LVFPIPAMSAIGALCARSPPGLFSSFLANKGASSNRPLDGPCVTLGWPLGHAWATQGPPNPRPNPNQQRVATQIPRDHGDSCPSPCLPTRISKHLNGCIPDHSNLAWVQRSSIDWRRVLRSYFRLVAKC
jgi:hypothetical protein